MTEFFENNFADFSDVVRVKKNHDFVQPLVTFPISSISILFVCLYNGVFWGKFFLDCLQLPNGGARTSGWPGHMATGKNVTSKSEAISYGIQNFYLVSS